MFASKVNPGAFGSTVIPGVGWVLLSYRQTAAYRFCGRLGPETLAEIQKVAARRDWKEVRLCLQRHSPSGILPESTHREILRIDPVAVRRQFRRHRLSALGM